MKQRNHQSVSANSFMEWKRDVDGAMSADYGITIIDAGIDDARLRQHWTDEQSPTDFVAWFATKYDLTPLSEWGWYSPKAKP